MLALTVFKSFFCELTVASLILSLLSELRNWIIISDSRLIYIFLTVIVTLKIKLLIYLCLVREKRLINGETAESYVKMETYA